MQVVGLFGVGDGVLGGVVGVGDYERGLGVGEDHGGDVHGVVQGQLQDYLRARGQRL